MLLYQYATTTKYYGILLYYYTAMLLKCNTTISLYYYITKLLYYYITSIVEEKSKTPSHVPRLYLSSHPPLFCCPKGWLAAGAVLDPRLARSLRAGGSSGNAAV